MDSGEEIDRMIWLNAQKNDVVTPGRDASIKWLFSEDMTISFCLLKERKVLKFEEDILRQLALFDFIACLWERMPHHVADSIYHSELRIRTTNELTSSEDVRFHKLPTILLPWMTRTLNFLNHQDAGRKYSEQTGLVLQGPTSPLGEILVKKG